MKRLGLVAIPLALLAVLVITGCGKTPGNGNTGPSIAPGTVEMASTDFVNHAVTISAGQAVHFTDPADTGGTHILCLGTNETCDKSAQGPSELKGNDLQFNPGDSKDVTFATAGTYHVTCSIHQNMNVVVTVQ